jgi:hypothetical protein
MQKKHDDEINILRQQISELVSEASRQRTKEELTALRETARAKAAEEVVVDDKLEEMTFKSGGLGLQALNLEISVTGDGLFSSRQDMTSDESSDFEFRNLGIHIELWLEPYTHFKSAVEAHEDETGDVLASDKFGVRLRRHIPVLVASARGFQRQVPGAGGCQSGVF